MHDVIIMVFIMVSLGHSTHPPSAMSIAFISISLLLLFSVAVSSMKLSLLLLLSIFISVLLSVGSGGSTMAGADDGARWSSAHPSRLAIDGKHIIL